MPSKMRRLSLAEQTAGQLREDLRDRSGKLPGVNALASEYDVSRRTMRSALLLLEREGLVSGGGNGRPRTACMGPENQASRHERKLRVGVLLAAGMEAEDPAFRSILYRIQLDLEKRGHEFFIAGKSMREMKGDVRRISKYVEQQSADAWLVTSGSRPVLEWLASGPVPAFACGGRSSGLRIASAGALGDTVLRDATARLVAMGHRRIIILSPRVWREPAPAKMVRDALLEMEEHGIRTGTYNLPDWDETPGGLYALLDALFATTPPTALLVGRTIWLEAVKDFLLMRRLSVPDQVSLVSLHPCHEDAHWQRPLIAHGEADDAAVYRKIRHWLRSLEQGKDNRKQYQIPMHFVETGSIGPIHPDAQ